jgi:hypothetical protein
MMVSMPRPVVRKKCAQMRTLYTVSAGQTCVNASQHETEGYF